MGRPLKARYEITGRLLAETPVHVGGGNDDVVIDMPLAVDGDGRFYLPGTSLTGPLRSWWARVFSEREAELVFGKPARPAPNEGHASFVHVADALLARSAITAGSADVFQEIRDGVGIDRYSGTAADGIKYDRATLPKDAAFDFRMTIEVPTKLGNESDPVAEFVKEFDNLLQSHFGILLSVLEAGEIRFGGAKTRGLGRLRLVDPKVIATDLGSRAGIFAILGSKQGADRHADWVSKSKAPEQDALRIRILWRPGLPVMSKSGAGGVLVDALPFVTVDGAALRPVLPGSAIKGALRSHAERIWRSVAGNDAPRDEERDVFARQLSGVERADSMKPAKTLDAANLARFLFGSVAEARDKTKRDRSPSQPRGREELPEANGRLAPLPGLGAVTIDDCIIGPQITGANWAELLKATCNEDSLKLKTAGTLVAGAGWSDFALPVAHAAIDRWTGGAADTALFGALEIKSAGPFEIVLTVDPSRIACPSDRAEPLRDPKDATARQALRRRIKGAALALLVLTLCDLAKRRIPLGFGVNRGLGSVVVESVKISGRVADLLDIQDGVVLQPADFDRPDKMARFERLDNEWRAYQVTLGTPEGAG